jgi:uncharacterized membrane protein YgdD (TMEM256/DUF423 family)
VKPNWIAIGCVLGAIAVVGGAFGAHGLKERISPEALEVWKTGVLYNALHAIALVLYGVFDREGRKGAAGWCFLCGIALFSGSLYALALGAPRIVGAITPFGGVLLTLGWIAFAFQARRR